MKIIKIIVILALYAMESFGVENLRYLQDHNSTFTISQVIEKQDQFKPLTTNYAKFGVTKATIWLSFTLTNDSPKAKEHIIDFKSSFNQYVTLYSVGETIEASHNGTQINIDDREIYDANIIFSITLDAYKTQQYFLKVQTNNLLLISINSYDKRDFEEIVVFDHLFYGFVFGILILAIIYNLFIFVFIKDNIFLIYVVFIFSQLVCLLFYSAYILYFIESFDYYSHIFLLSQIFLITFLLLLIKSFFKTKSQFKTFDLIFNIFIVAINTIALIIPIDLGLAIKLKNLYLFISVLFVIAFVFHLYQKKHNKIDFLFMLGWLIYILSGVYTTLVYSNLFNLSEDSDTTHYIFTMGIVIETIVFSLVLSYKFYKLNQDKINLTEANLKKDRIIHFKNKVDTIGEMYSHIEHQWREPLAQINANLMGLYNYLETHPIDSQHKQELHAMINHSEETIAYMSKVMSSFRNFYKNDTQKSFFFIDEVIENALKMALNISQNEHISVKIESDEAVEIEGYPNELAQIFLNICSNSFKAFRGNAISNPKLIITITPHKNIVNMSVVDNAGGIPQEKIESIFDPLSSSPESTGVGLYLARNIIQERMDGDLLIENYENGVKVTVRLLLD